jgi:HD-like signal output (HDOD) protein
LKVVYFVDDEPRVLEGLRRSLRPLRKEWAFELHSSAVAALERMKEVTPDVIVSDMRMPVMDGAAFLDQVCAEYPDTIRFILSGHAEFGSISKVMRNAHQVLRKPFETEDLIRVLKNADLLRERFKDAGVATAISGLGALPSIPAVLSELTDLLQRDEVDQRVVAETVARDPALVIRVLQVANSGFFSPRSRIESIDQAVVMLGLKMLNHLVVQVKIVEAFPSTSAVFSPERLGLRASRIADFATQIATPDTNTQQLLEQASVDGAPVWKVERRTFGVDHAAVGAYLLGLWGQDPALVERVAQQLVPLSRDGEEQVLLLLLHVAAALVDSGGDRSRFERLVQLGVTEHPIVATQLDEWLELAAAQHLEDAPAGAAAD